MGKGIIDVGEFASIAEGLTNYSYNEILNLMEKDKILPLYRETGPLNLYKGYGKDYGYSEELSAVIDSVVENKGEVIVIN